MLVIKSKVNCGDNFDRVFRTTAAAFAVSVFLLTFSAVLGVFVISLSVIRILSVPKSSE